MATGPETKAIVAAERAVTALSLGVTATRGSTRLGPFVINHRMDEEEAHVDASVKVGSLKSKLFSATLTRRKNRVSASAKAVVVKASLAVVANFDKMTLTAVGQVCHKTLKGLKVKWKCKHFSARLS
jgi:hypothetical protein